MATSPYYPSCFVFCLMCFTSSAGAHRACLPPGWLVHLACHGGVCCQGYHGQGCLLVTPDGLLPGDMHFVPVAYAATLLHLHVSSLRLLHRVLCQLAQRTGGAPASPGSPVRKMPFSVMPLPLALIASTIVVSGPFAVCA